MKQIILSLVLAASLCSCSVLSNINWDQQSLQNASAMALSAATITDAQVIALCQQSVAEMDAQNVIENGSYKKRLDRLMANVKDINGIPVNYKVYKLNEVNAFACGDGSIRVYTGLMDIMNDAELMAIIGHECGHVAHQDSKNAMRNAYLAAAARQTINAVGGTVGTLSKSVLGDLGEAFVSSQYSQKQEYKADEYGFNFAISHGFGPYSMHDALNELLKLSGSSQSNLVQRMFASHPGTEERCARTKTMAEEYEAKR